MGSFPPTSNIPAPNAHSAVAGKSFWFLMQRCALIAGFTHASFVALFYALHADIMAWTNLGSVALFALAYIMLRQRRNQLAIPIVVIEIFAHAALAVWAIGWDSGFHYYVIMMPPIMMLSPTRFRGSGLVLVCITCGIYLVLDAAFRGVPPLYQISPPILAALRYFNVIVTFSLLGFLAATYLRLVRTAERQLTLAATTDPLTGLYNRRHIATVFNAWITRRKRESAPLSFLLCDIDYFKQINDTHGHEIGDRVLKAVAGCLQATLREQDNVARWGGEEFLVVLPHTGLAEALRAAERIRCAVAAVTVATATGEVTVTLTLGAAEHRSGEDADAVIARADAALYAGKQQGRDRVVAELAAAGAVAA